MAEPNEAAENMYWSFKALQDATQEECPMSERDAFKLVVLACRADLAPALGLIPVSERLPSHLHSVLGFVINGPLVLDIDDGMFDIVSYSPDANVWLQNYGDMDAHVTVTHWMPLPDAPDTQEQSNG